MKHLKFVVFSTMTTASFFTSSALAEVRFNGFASIRATTVDSDTGVSPYLRYEGDGETSFKDDSLFALQATADLTEGLTATVQILAEGRNDFDAEAFWAYLRYQVNDTHAIQVGRLANPVFFQSQYEKVGFAHNFGRLPRAVYDDLDINTLDGVALVSTFFVGDYTLDTQLTYGSWEGEFVTETFGELDGALNDILSVNATLSGDWWKIFAGGFVAENGEGEGDGLFLNLFAPSLAAAAASGASQSEIAAVEDFLVTEGEDVTYWFAGFNIDYNNFIIDFEYADYVIDNTADATNQVWYAAVGYRYNANTFTLHTEDFSQDANFIETALTNPILIGVANGISTTGAAREFDGVGFTWRYDFHPSAALKVDYFSGEDKRETIGDYDLWSVGVDFVF